MIYLILLLIYIISAFAMYKWIQIAFYHKNGVMKGCLTENIDLFYTFCPIMNTAFSIAHWIMMFPINKKSKNNNFFKPKNYDKTT